MSFPDLDRFVLEVDAWSRIAIDMANKANSPLIAQMGNLSHDVFRGGFISGDGCMAVSGDESTAKSVMERLPSCAISGLFAWFIM